MRLVVLTPDQEYFDGDVSSVKVPGTSGQFEILEHHAPIVSALLKGEVRLITSDGEKRFQIEKGFIEVLNNEVSLLVQGLSE